ncbi:MAG: spermidine/putrescine transport system substrate-binding protein potC [Acidobacteriota bacterium]|jgi:spermidine/putrescine-binding protein|nr:spermidine/putrescine transport system substrate-binding protein potC [Acidobacteriota bacterium]
MKKTAIAVTVSLLAACGAKTGPAPKESAGKVVNVYIWTNYLPQEVVTEFERRTGIHANVDTYDSNEAVLEKLQSGVADYDVVVPSDYMLKILGPQGLVRPLDHSRLPHFANLDPRFLDQKYDPGNAHSIPYLWGTTGIGYDKTKIQEPVDSWAVLFDPRHAGRILMLDDVREAFGAALKLMGRSINERNPAILRQAADRLKQQKRLVRTYNSSDFANLLAAGDVDVAQGWNGEMAEAVASSKGRLAYLVPKEGGTLWIDNLAIPKGARNVDAAYTFLDFVMEPEIAAKIVNHVHYAVANRAALPLIDAKIRNDPSIYPPQEVLDRCELIEDLGETTQLLDRLWTEVKAQ